MAKIIMDSMTTVLVPLQESPRFVKGLEFTKAGNNVKIEVVKRSDNSYGYVELSPDELYKIFEVLGFDMGDD